MSRMAAALGGGVWAWEPTQAMASIITRPMHADQGEGRAVIARDVCAVSSVVPRSHPMTALPSVGSSRHWRLRGPSRSRARRNAPRPMAAPSWMGWDGPWLAGWLAGCSFPWDWRGRDLVHLLSMTLTPSSPPHPPQSASPQGIPAPHPSMMKAACTATRASLLLFLLGTWCWGSLVSGLHFYLRAKEQKCFVEDIPADTTLVGGCSCLLFAEGGGGGVDELLPMAHTKAHRRAPRTTLPAP
jgi:hypothetical protein